MSPTGDWPIPDCSRCPRPLSGYLDAQLSRPKQYKFLLTYDLWPDSTTLGRTTWECDTLEELKDIVDHIGREPS